jgi:hypothetical protein
LYVFQTGEAIAPLTAASPSTKSNQQEPGSTRAIARTEELLRGASRAIIVELK